MMQELILILTSANGEILVLKKVSKTTWPIDRYEPLITCFKNFNESFFFNPIQAEILDKLRQCGVGQRPVIFVGHSMGGLIAKKMLLQAQAEQDHDLVDNTKGMVFFSTPHLGSSVAKLNSATKFFFFPSTEVNDLEENSHQLVDLNANFKNLAKEKEDLRIISFGEALTTPMFGIDMTFVSPKPANGLKYGI